ncbi:MAG: S-methyl-5-thioribose-1-phosphate isomerase [Thermodesulfobacteriota bacterium]|nr:S-methyl-5-thioribose-1-phosphate isomerase [Thermodesulfobacteriota bacterium]
MRPFYFEESSFYILDQRALPNEEVWIRCTRADDVVDAIKTLAIRGAPAIGIAAAYALVLEDVSVIDQAAARLMNARPTAVNLRWAVKRMLNAVSGHKDARQEADAIWAQEIEANRTMADLGASLFKPDRQYRILTHCNAGCMATGGMGTALGVVRRLHQTKRLEMVYADETRPLLQGARITAYELSQDNIPVTLITDSMAGWLMQQGRIDVVIVGADRIAANLDTANKIGTYPLALLCSAHDIPFYVAAPMSTFDMDAPTGNDVPIEERPAREVLGFGSTIWAPEVKVYNPAFDVTPHALITAIITEKGIITPGKQNDGKKPG